MVKQTLIIVGFSQVRRSFLQLLRKTIKGHLFKIRYIRLFVNCLILQVAVFFVQFVNVTLFSSLEDRPVLLFREVFFLMKCKR